MADPLSKFVDSIFNMKKTTILLISIFVLGFVLRLVAAINLSVSADDMHHVLHAINFLGANRLITYDQSSGLWHLLTSLFYNIFGITQLTSRMAALIFGSLSIFVIYILCNQFFNKKTSIIASLLLAIAPFHIKNTYGEMDVMAMFFVLTAMYFFVIATKEQKNRNFVFAGLFIGLAIYTKVYPLLFIPSLLVYFFIKRPLNKKNLKKIGIFLLIGSIFATPALTHNYLLYQDKGFMDLQFTRTLGFGKETASQYYSWDPIFHKSNSWSGLILGDKSLVGSGIPLILAVFNFIREGDPVVFYLAILGLILIIYKRKENMDYVYFSIAGIFFAAVFLGSIILLPKHFIFIELLFIPLAAFFVSEIDNKLKEKLGKHSTKIIACLLIISSLVFLSYPGGAQQHFYSKSAVSQAIDFKNSEILKDSLIVFDSRIYTGEGYWISTQRPVLDGQTFVSLIEKQDSIEGNLVNARIYYVECVLDDCGWGREKAIVINESMEQLTEFFKQNSDLVKTIEEPTKGEPYNQFLSIGEKREVYKIYSVSGQLKEPILMVASQPKNWFLYDIGYQPENKQFDYYQTNGFFGFVLNELAKIVSRTALIISLISMLFVFYIVLKK